MYTPQQPPQQPMQAVNQYVREYNYHAGQDYPDPADAYEQALEQYQDAVARTYTHVPHIM